MQQHASTYSVLTHTLDPWGGVKGQNNFFSEVVMLHFRNRFSHVEAYIIFIWAALFSGYYVMLGWFAPELDLFTPWSLPIICQLYLSVSVFLVLLAACVVLYWSRNNWNSHPIAKQLGYLADENSSWRAVAASINIEFRRIDKFTSGMPTGRRIVVTDSWVIKTSTYFVYVAHQNDIHLTLDGTEEHTISYENMTSVQFLSITVASINTHIKPFSLR